MYRGAGGVAPGHAGGYVGRELLQGRNALVQALAGDGGEFEFDHVERPGGGLGRAALRGQAQGFGTDGRVILAALVGFEGVFRDEVKIPPCCVLAN